MFDDLLKNGAAEYYENKRAIVLANGQINTNPLARKTTIYTDSNPTVTCEDASGQVITEEEYERIADTVYSGRKKYTAHFEWRDGKELDGLLPEESLELLREAYGGFYFTEE